MLRSTVCRVSFFSSSARSALPITNKFISVGNQSLVGMRSFCAVARTTSKVLEAVTEFLDQRKMELEQYEAADVAEKEETRALIEKLAKVKLGATTSWSELGLDGLDEVELVLAIESHLGLTLTDDEFHSIHSVADAVKVLEKYAPQVPQ